MRSDGRAQATSGGSIDYEQHAHDYALRRRADPRIAAAIAQALGRARTVVNVGAGTGSYEPTGLEVIAIEPSAAMRAARPAQLPRAVAACAERLPLADASVDAAMAVATVHHWSDRLGGLRELARVARTSVVVLSFDIDCLADFWLVNDYLPEVLVDDRRRFMAPEEIAAALGGDSTIQAIPIPRDCTDGFLEAYWARPEAYLDAGVRSAQSIWPRLPKGSADRALGALSSDLNSGAWDERHGRLRAQDSYQGSLCLIVCRLPGH